MRFSSPTDSDSYFSTRGDNVFAGVTRAGLHCTTSNPTATFSQDPTEILDANKDEDWTGYNPLPVEGEEVLYNTIYSDGADLVLSRATHTRTNSAPELEPDLFITHRDFGNTIDWQEGEAVLKGAIRAYNGKNYKVIQPHITQEDWTPDVVPALWLEVVDEGGGVPEWVAPTGSHDAYHVGDEVTYKETHYRCIAGDANGNNVWAPDVYGWEVV